MRSSSLLSPVLLGLMLIAITGFFAPTLLGAVNNSLAANQSVKQVAVSYPLDVKLVQVAQTPIATQTSTSPSPSQTESPLRPGSRDLQCMIVLNKHAAYSLDMYGSSSLVAPKCAIRSLSRSKQGVSFDDVELLDIAKLYGGGQFDRALETYEFEKIPNSSAIEDPFAQIKLPQTDGCDHENLALKAGNHTLQPGVYCGGIVSFAAKEIQLEPGVYIIKNGPLALGGRSSLVGKGVSLYFDGPNSVFNFGIATKVALTAPTAGPMAGILFLENPSSPKYRDFVVRSYDARVLEGAIYLPRGRFIVDNYGRVGEASNWMALIANQVQIINGGHLQINSNHAASDVPLPKLLDNIQ